MDEVIQDFISRGHMNRDFKDKLKSIILSQHRSQTSHAASAMHGRKPTISDLFSSSYRPSRINSNHSFIENFGSALFGRSHTVNQFKPPQFKHEEVVSLHDLNKEDRVLKKKFLKAQFIY